MRRVQKRPNAPMFANRRGGRFHPVLPRDRDRELLGGQVKVRINRGVPAGGQRPGNAHLHVASDGDNLGEIAHQHGRDDVTPGIQQQDTVHLERPIGPRQQR
jgi:hypothetical protein